MPASASLACFVNPYGTALVTFPVDLLRRGDALDGVIEWSSPDFHTVPGIAFGLWIAVFVVVVAKAPRGRVTLRDLVVTVPFLVLGLWALRNVDHRAAHRPARCSPEPSRCRFAARTNRFAPGVLAAVTSPWR